MSYTPPPGYRVALTFAVAYTPPPGYRVAIAFRDPIPVPFADADAYTTTFGKTLTVAAPGVLANDTLNSATAAWTSGPAHGTLTFSADGSFTYVPATGYSGADAFVYTLTNSSGSSSATVTITVQPLPPAQRYAYASGGLPYTTAPRARRSVGSGWTRAPHARVEPRMAWSAAPSLQRSFGAPWALVPRVRADMRLPWGLPPSLHHSAGIPWLHVPQRQVSIGLPWSRPPAHGHSAGVPWRNPPHHQIAAGLPWTTPPFRHRGARVPFDHPPLHSRRWWLPWGHAHPVQWSVHSPGVLPPPIVPPGSYVPPRGDRVAIDFSCPQLQFRGDQVPVPFGPAACYFAWPKPKVYVMENSASVVRLPERSPISVESIALAQSVDDAHWSMSMDLGDPVSLDLLKADAGGPKVVEITINGYVWTTLVEAYQQDRQHPTRKVRVSGRSQSALLDAPYAQPRSKTEPADKLAEQLIDAELAGLAIDAELRPTGYSADYSAVVAQTGAGGWTVTGGAFHYQAATPIAVVRTVAAASGAVVQAHPWDTQLIVAPRFKVSPWDWSTTAPDKMIQDDIILHDSARLVSKPLYDYVLVSGEQTGVSDEIIRTGELGATRAPMVVDALMTDHVATRERGRNVLCDRGEQAQVDITIPLFPATTPDTPGLILPLQLVQVIELQSWKALALGTHISAQVREVNGVGVLVVEQTVTVERHYSDAG